MKKNNKNNSKNNTLKYSVVFSLFLSVFGWAKAQEIQQADNSTVIETKGSAWPGPL